MKKTLSKSNTNILIKFESSRSFSITTRESSTIEFKQSFNWNNKQDYCKTLVAFANNKGGTIIFGVTDTPRKLKGLETSNFKNLDESKITEYLNSSFSPEIAFKKSIHKIRGKTIGHLNVTTISKPVIAIKNDGQNKEGDIFYRYNARSEKIKFPELNSIINEIREYEKQSWIDLFKNISQIGPNNAAVLDTINGKITGNGGTLIIDEKLMKKVSFIKKGVFQKRGKPVLKLIGDVYPISLKGYKSSIDENGDVKVQFTTDRTAPEIRLNEETILKNYPLDYKELSKILKKRYKNFRMGPKYHNARKRLRSSLKYGKSRYHNPSNPKSGVTWFHNKAIIQEFDKLYKK